MDWKAISYAFGIPAAVFLIDLGMRRLIKAKSLEFDEYCFGADLGLAGLTTGLAGLPELQHPDFSLVAVVLFVSLGCWIGSMIIHQAFEPDLESQKRWVRLYAKFFLVVVANAMGAAGLGLVLWLMWKR